MVEQESKVICVIGMGRSGTSLVANILKLIGVYFGSPEDLVGYEPIEHRRFRTLDAKILKSLGGTYDNPPLSVLQTCWQHNPDLKNFKQQALAFVRDEFRAVPIWAWKTPSSTLMLPFWETIISDISCPRYVICLRNPIDVANSYEKFRGFPPVKSMYLWLLYTALSLEYTVCKPRLLIFYEDIFANWERQLLLLARFVGYKHHYHDKLPDIRYLLKRDLWHHHSTISDIFSSDQLPSVAKSLYLLLRASAWKDYNLGHLNGEWGEALNILIKRAKEEYHRKFKSPKNRMIMRLGRLASPIIPNRIKPKLVRVRDRFTWS